MRFVIRVTPNTVHLDSTPLIGLERLRRIIEDRFKTYLTKVPKLLALDMATTKIRKTAGICNGAACIGRTQIPVWKLIALYADGCSEANLLSDYPDLTKDDLKAARTYYAQNPIEIDEAMVAQRTDERHRGSIFR